MSNVKVLYEDNHVIAVFKPAGVLSQGDNTGDVSMYDMVKDYIRIKKGKLSLLNPGNAKPRSEATASTTGVFLGLVHRLDRPVSGIMLFAKTSKGASRLSEQFRNHAIQKTYHGIVVGKPAADRGDVKGKVKKISFFAEGFSHKSDQQILEEIKKATKTRTAELYYEVVPMPEASRMLGGETAGIKSGKYSLVKIIPKTGRFHQIRIQMAERGTPILGDVKHGAKEPLPDKSIALCATEISFKTATNEKIITLKVDLPENWQNSPS